MQNYENLRVWRAAHAFVCRLYPATAVLPPEERYEVRRQVRRAAVSIPANIAEGASRATDPDFAQFLRIALGSANEVDYYLVLTRDLGMLAPERVAELRAELRGVRAMLIRMIQRVAASRPDRR